MSALVVMVVDATTGQPLVDASVNGHKTDGLGIVTLENAGEVGAEAKVTIRAKGYEILQATVVIPEEDNGVKIPLVKEGSTPKLPAQAAPRPAMPNGARPNGRSAQSGKPAQPGPRPAMPDDDEDEDDDGPTMPAAAGRPMPGGRTAPGRGGRLGPAVLDKMRMYRTVMFIVLGVVVFLLIAVGGIYLLSTEITPADPAALPSEQQPGLTAAEEPGLTDPAALPSAELPGEIMPSMEQPGTKPGSIVTGDAPDPEIEVSFLSLVFWALVVVSVVEPTWQLGLVGFFQGITPILTVVLLSKKGQVPESVWFIAFGVLFVFQVIGVVSRAVKTPTLSRLDFTCMGITAALLLLLNFGAVSALGYPQYIPMWVLWVVAVPSLIREGIRNFWLSILALVLGIIAGWTLSPWTILGAPLLLVVVMVGSIYSGIKLDNHHDTTYEVGSISIPIPWDSFTVYIITFALTGFIARGGDWLIWRTVGG